MSNLRRCLYGGMIVVMASSILAAQDDRPFGPPPVPKKVEQYKKMRLIEDLHLDEETSVRFFSRYNKHMEQMREIQRHRFEIVKHLRSLTQSNTSTPAFETEIANYKKTEEQIADLRTSFIDGLKDIFTPKQIAEYLIFEQQFNQNLRDVIRDMARDRMHRDD